jgi:signal transduction histidine kinase
MTARIGRARWGGLPAKSPDHWASGVMPQRWRFGSLRDSDLRPEEMGHPAGKSCYARHMVVAGARLPVDQTLDALTDWGLDPRPPRLRALREALHALVEVNGAEGAYLAVDAPPLPTLRLGLGVLHRRPAATTTEANEFPLHSRANGQRLGSLWLAGGGERRLSAVRAIEVALDAVWSRAQAREVLGQMAALDDASRAIAGVLSLTQVLQLIVDRVRGLARAEYAALGTVDERGDIKQFFTSGLTRTERTRIGALPHGRGLLGLIIRDGRSIRIDDISSDPRRSGFPANHPAMRTFLGVPVTVKGRSVGNLYLTNKLNGAPFSGNDQRIVETFALHAGIAIENASLHEDVQRLAVVEERDRIGRDLHDSIIQNLYAVGLSLEDVPELMDELPAEAKARVERAIDSLHEAIGEMRTFIFGLRPELLDQADLATGLATLADELRVNTMLDVRLELDGWEPTALSPDRSVEVLQIAREALSNVARHAGATMVDISLSRDGSALRLRIADNGVGFPPDAPRAATHQGLANMRERASALGAHLLLTSREGAGTDVELRVPGADRKRGSEQDETR